MDILVSLHSFWRYAVLIAAVVGFLGALGGWLGGLPPRLSARRAGSIYIIALDIQIVLGLIVYVGKSWWASPGFFRAEHPATMILAAVVAHVGQVMAKRSGSPKGAALTIAIAILISFILVLVGIPGIVRNV